MAAVSPDGTRIVFFAADASGKGALWLRALDAFEAFKLPNTDDGFQPFWSPDGSSIAFFAGRRLYRLDVARGERAEICAFDGNPRGASWGAAGTIIFATTNPPALLSVSARGGTATPVSIARPADMSPPVWPSFLPDGRRFLYFARTRAEGDGGIYLAEMGSAAESKRVVNSTIQGAFIEPGFLLYGLEARLVRQAFDPTTGQVSGDAVPVVDQLRATGAQRFGEFSASHTGVLAFRSGADASMQFTWVDRKGKPVGTVGQPGRYRTSSLSPDGTRLVYTDLADSNLKIIDLVTGITTLFTSEPGVETAPVWSSDGATIYYRSDRGGAFAKSVNGLSGATRILDTSINGPTQFFLHPTRGPLSLYFQGPPFQPTMDIFMLPLDGTAKPQVVVATPFAEAEPQVSPNGKWMAYTSGDMGDYEIDVVPFLAGGAKVRVSREGGRQPYWRADSSELFFVSNSRRFYALKVPESGPSRDIEPEFLFEMHAIVANARNSYVVKADGSRFLVTTVLDTEDSPINVITNWMPAVK